MSVIFVIVLLILVLSLPCWLIVELIKYLRRHWRIVPSAHFV